jgi:hypothetical protein
MWTAVACDVTTRKLASAAAASADRLSGIGEILRVSSDGLEALAGRCDTAATAVITTPPIGGPLHHATAAAVAAGYEAVSAVGAALAGRATAIGS